MSTPKKISTDGGAGGFGQNPFGALDGLALPDKPVVARAADQAKDGGGKGPGAGGGAVASAAVPVKNRGRVDIVREKMGRGGKTVTVATGFMGIGLPEKEQLAKKMQKACGAGGTVKDGRIEIQGDNREVVARVLTEAGFRPVFAGG